MSKHVTINTQTAFVDVNNSAEPDFNAAGILIQNLRGLQVFVNKPFFC